MTSHDLDFIDFSSDFLFFNEKKRTTKSINSLHRFQIKTQNDVSNQKYKDPSQSRSHQPELNRLYNMCTRQTETALNVRQR